MKRPWKFLINVFLNVTKGSYVKMLSLITDHESKLKAKKSDADIQAIIERTTNVKNELSAKFNTWKSAKGTYEGETLRFGNLMNELNDEKISRWEAMVRIEYPERSADFRIIFPDGRTTFRKGNYETRIAKVGALAQTLLNYEPLLTAQGEVDAFYKELLAARDVQQQKEQLTASSSGELEQARIAAGEIMYANLGYLMNKYYQNPETIEEFFELENIRRHEGKSSSEPYVISIEPNSTIDAEIEFDENDVFRFNNFGDVALYAFSAATPEATCPENAIVIEAGSEKSCLASELGDAGNEYILITNKNSELEGEIEILIV